MNLSQSSISHAAARFEYMFMQIYVVWSPGVKGETTRNILSGRDLISDNPCYRIFVETIITKSYCVLDTRKA